MPSELRKTVQDEAEAAAGQPGMQALTRGLAVLDLVAGAPTPPRFTTLLERSGLPKGTLHRVLQTLIEERYLQVDAGDQTYRLGVKPFELAHRVWDQFDLRGAAEPELIRLRDLTGEAVRLGILDNGEVLYIDQRDVARALRLSNGVGSRAAIHASALGKAMAAHLNGRDRKALVDATKLVAFTDRTIVSAGDLDQQLNIIKARGYAVSVEEQHEGVSAVAAAILDHKAEPLGAIGIIGPSFRLPEDALHGLGREVIEAARRIAGNVGELAMSITINPRPLDLVREDVRCVIPSANFLGEGPHWSEAEGWLSWVDILAPAFIVGDPATGERREMPLPELIGVAVPKKSGGWLAATESGIKALSPDGTLTLLAAPEADRPGNRFNDGKCDRRGRFWVGSLAINTAPRQGSLWRYDPDGTVTRVESGMHISNGLGWSPDDTRFYFTDSAKREIYVYDFDIESGAIENRRTFVTALEGSGTPDGLAVDAEGFVWSAHWDGWSVVRYDPDGGIDRVVNLPVPRPTSCVFGGLDRSTLYVTTARIRLSTAQLAEAPLSGGIFAVETGVRGQHETIFAG